MDNGHPVDHEKLKEMTFKDIFTTTNREANSLKRSLNYSNYSKMGYDIFTKKERNPIY